MFSMRKQQYDDEDEFNDMEQRIVNNRITLEEAVHFQALMDRRIKKLLSATPEELFTKSIIEKTQVSFEIPSIYLTCCHCGHQVLKNRSIDYHNRIYCISCFDRICNEYGHCNIQ